MFLSKKAEVIQLQNKNELHQLELKKNKDILQLKTNLEEKQKQIQDLQNKLESKAKEKARIAAEQQSVQSTTIAVQTAQTAPTQPTVAIAGSAKAFIYMKESGNNPGAINRSSGACGLGQALPCSKMPCSLSDYACQDNFFTQYMQNRYGTWENAQAFWLSHSWW